MAFRLSDKAKDVVKVVAPSLGAALGGPLGGLAGQILGQLVAGGKPADVEAAILEQKPETLLALKKLDQEYKLKLEELGVEEKRIEMADRVSARDLAKVNMRPQMALSFLFIGGYFMILAAFFVGDIQIPQEVREPFLILLGVITANVPSIMQFWFGTSSGSQRKTDLLMEQAGK